MEDVSRVAFWFAVGATGVAAVAYWVHVLGLRVTVRRLATEAGEGPGVPAVETGSSGWAEPAGALGSVAMPLVLAMLVVAALFFPADIRPLVPALQNSDLLAVHVALMILSYGALSVSFAAAVMHLAQGGSVNRFARLPRARTLDDVAY